MYKIGQVSKLSAWLIFFFIHTTKGIPADELFLCLFLKNSEWTLGVQQVRGRMVLIARHLRERSLQVEHQRLPGQGVRLDVKVSQSPFLRPLIMWNYFMEHRLLFLPGEGVRLDVKVGQSQFLRPLIMWNYFIEHWLLFLPGEGVRLDVKVGQSQFLRPLIMWNYFIEHRLLLLPGEGVRLDVKVGQSQFLRPLIMWNYFIEHRLLFLPGEGVRLDVKVGQSQFLKESQKLVMKILPSLCEWVSHPVRWGNWLSLQVQVTKFKQSERLSMPQLVHWCLYRCKSSRAQYNKTLNLHDELIFGISKMFVLGMFFTWWTSPSEVVVAYSKTASLE